MQPYSEGIPSPTESAMQASWFFATTPAPHRPLPALRSRRTAHSATPSWWTRAGERIVAWGENANHHRMGSWTQR